MPVMLGQVLLWDPLFFFFGVELSALIGADASASSTSEVAKQLIVARGVIVKVIDPLLSLLLMLKLEGPFYL